MPVVEDVLSDSTGGKLTPEALMANYGKLAVCIDDIVAMVRAVRAPWRLHRVALFRWGLKIAPKWSVDLVLDCLTDAAACVCVLCLCCVRVWWRMDVLPSRATCSQPRQRWCSR